MSKTRRECLAVLGLPLTASDDDIRKAYRQKALELHPDKNQNDPNATERFQTLQEAYRTLVNDDDEEGVVIFVDPLFVIIKLMEMHERRQRMQREFGFFPFGPSTFGGCGLFSHHNHDDDDDDEEEEYFYQRNRSSRNFHTGSSSTGRRTTRFAATEHDRENIPKSKESHVKPKQNNSNQQQQEKMTSKQKQKKKSKGGWNTTKKKKNQRNTQWGKMSSNTNNDEKESNWSEQDYFSEEYENCHDFQEFPKDKNATAPLPNEEKRPQKDGACKTSMTTESKQKMTNITEQNSATVEKSTGHDKHSQNDEAKTPNNIQTEENSSSSFKMKSTQEPSKKEENIEEHENTSSLEEPSPVSSDRIIEDKVHTDPSQFTKTTAPTQEATNSKGVHVSSSEPRNIAKLDNDDDVGVKRPSTCSTKSTSHLHEKSFTDQETVSESLSFQTPKSCASSTGPTSTDSHNQLGDVNNGAKVSRKQRKKNKKKKQNEKQSQMEESVEKAGNPTVQNACTESQRSYDGNTESSHTCTKTEIESTTGRDSNADRIISDTETVIPKSKTKTTAEKGNAKVRSGHSAKLPENAKDFQSKNIPSTSDENGKTVRATNKVQSAGDRKIPVTGQRSSQHFQERQTKVPTVSSDEWPKTPKQDGAAKNVSKDQKLPVEEQNSGSGRGSYPLQDYPQYQQNWCGRINKPKESGNNDWKFPSQEQQHLVNGDVKGYQFQEHPHYQEKPFEKVSKPKESGNAHVNDRKCPVQECARGNEENYQFQENPKESPSVRLNDSKFQVREEQHHQNLRGSYKSRVHGYYQNLGVQQQQRQQQQQHIINGVPGGLNQERPQNQNTGSVTNARVRPNVSSPPSVNSTRTFPVFGQQQQRVPQSTPTQQQELYVPQPTPQRVSQQTQRVPQPTPQHVPQPTPQHASQPTRVSQQIPQSTRVPQQTPTPQRYVPQPTPRVPQPFHVTTPRVPQPFHVTTPRVPQPFHVPIPRVPQPFHVPIPRVPQPFHVPIPRVPQPQQRQSVQQQHHFHHPQQQQPPPNINGFVNHFQEIPGDFPSLYTAANTAQDRTGTSKVASNLDHKNIREQFDRYLDHHVDHTVADRCMKLISIARGEPTE